MVAVYRWPPAQNRLSWLFVISSLGCFACLLLSFSRGTYLAVLCFAASYAFFERRRRHVIRVLAVASCLVLVMALSSRDIAKAMWDTMTVRATESQQRSMNGRFKIASESARLALRKPLIGVGPGNFPYAWQTYASYEQTNVVAESYNLLLNTTVESGVLGATALLLVGAGMGMCLYDLRRATSVPGSATVVSACLALMFLSLFHSFLFSGRATSFYIYVLLAVLAGESGLRAGTR
jgi:O-antigen ligase